MKEMVSLLLLFSLSWTQPVWGGPYEDRSAEVLPLDLVGSENAGALRMAIYYTAQRIETLRLLGEVGDMLDLTIYLEGESALALSAKVRRAILKEQNGQDPLIEPQFSFDEIFVPGAPLNLFIENKSRNKNDEPELVTEAQVQAFFAALYEFQIEDRVLGRGPWFSHKSHRYVSHILGIGELVPRLFDHAFSGYDVVKTPLLELSKKRPLSNLLTGLVELNAENGVLFVGDIREYIADRGETELFADYGGYDGPLFTDALVSGEAHIQSPKLESEDEKQADLEAMIRFLEGPLAYGFNIDSESLTFITNEVARAQAIDPLILSSRDSRLRERLYHFFSATAEHSESARQVLDQLGVLTKLQGLAEQDQGLSFFVNEKRALGPQSQQFELFFAEERPAYLRAKFDYELEAQRAFLALSHRAYDRIRELDSNLVGIGIPLDLSLEETSRYEPTLSRLRSIPKGGDPQRELLGLGFIRVNSLISRLLEIQAAKWGFDLSDRERSRLEWEFDEIGDILATLPVNRAAADAYRSLVLKYFKKSLETSNELVKEALEDLLKVALATPLAQASPELFEQVVLSGSFGLRTWIFRFVLEHFPDSQRWRVIAEAATLFNQKEREAKIEKIRKFSQDSITEAFSPLLWCETALKS